MKLPRSISGADLTSRLRKFGYTVSRQSGSHIRLTSNANRREHHVTIPAHRELKAGTLSAILNDVATYLEMDRNKLIESLFS